MDNAAVGLTPGEPQLAETAEMIISFDVFDTVLTRAVGSPEAVYLLLGRRLFEESLIQCTPEAFARARIEAERRAYRNAGREVTLDAIYAELAAALSLIEALRDRLIETELAVEASLIRAVPGALDQLQRARALGRQVVFVSDVYLPREFVCRQLARHGLWKEGDRCYFSSELGESKLSGRLFLAMLRSEGIRPWRVVHHGNSLEHDVRPAAELGIHTEQMLGANLNRYERLLEAHGLATEGLTSAMAGASRLARLSTRAVTRREVALRDVAAGVVAPTLVGFVLWILRRARQLGLKRLYFLSRDGQVLLDVARKLAPRLGLTCELRYLYGSRQSWNLPAIVGGTEGELAWIWDTTDLLTVKSLLARVALKPEQLEEQLRSIGLARGDWHRPLCGDERAALRQALNAGLFRDLVLHKAREKRRLLARYLDQEGVLDSAHWGFVDLGWYGSMQNALSSLQAELGGTQPVGFYFALRKGDVPDMCSARRESYYLDERIGAGFVGAVPNLIPLMEMFCVADHGTVIGFTEEGGEVLPVLRETSNDRVLNWGLSLVRQTIDRFVDSLLLDGDLMNPWADGRCAITEVLQAFWLRPSLVEAEAWGEFPLEDGLGAQSYWNRLAQPYQWKDILKAAQIGRIPDHRRTSWRAGSLALSPRWVQVALTVAARLAQRTGWSTKPWSHAMRRARRRASGAASGPRHRGAATGT